ncbi:winged helix-turn-helix domain-containing protein [Pantoea allii]|uniref:winged helix-turn-helix domain-containing protein n=1 Tax=Pantoea allii TaxID=574096 RepID=UPI003977DE8F
MLYTINGNIHFRNTDGTLWKDDEIDATVIALTVTTSRLLTYLIERHGEVASREDILETVWTMHGLRSSNNSLNKYIADLRKIFVTLELGTEVIITVPKVGFMISRDVDIEIKQTDDDVFTLQSTEEALPVIIQKRRIRPLSILILTAVIITGGVMSLFSDSVLKLELFGRNQIPESPVFYLGNVDGCKIMTLHPGSEKMTPVKLTLAREVMKHANISCTPDTDIYFQPSDSAIYGDKGRVFLSRCTFNKYAKGKFSACKNYYGVNYKK